MGCVRHLRLLVAPVLDFSVSIWSSAEELTKAFMMMLDRKTEKFRWLICAEAEAGKKLSAKGVNVIPPCEVYPFHLSKH